MMVFSQELSKVEILIIQIQINCLSCRKIFKKNICSFWCKFKTFSCTFLQNSFINRFKRKLLESFDLNIFKFTLILFVVTISNFPLGLFFWILEIISAGITSPFLESNIQSPVGGAWPNRELIWTLASFTIW